MPCEQAGVAGFEGFELQAGVTEGGVLRGFAEDEPLVLDGGDFVPGGWEGGEVGQGVGCEAGPLGEEEVGQAEGAEVDLLSLEFGGLEEGFGVFVVLGVTELGGVMKLGVPFFGVEVLGDFFFAATDFGFGGLFGFFDPLEDFDVTVEFDEVGGGEVELVVFGGVGEGGGARNMDEFAIEGGVDGVGPGFDGDLGAFGEAFGGFDAAAFIPPEESG